MKEYFQASLRNIFISNMHVFEVLLGIWRKFDWVLEMKDN